MSSTPLLSATDAGSTPRESPIPGATLSVVPPNGNEPTRFADVAEEVFTRYGRTWKPGTIAVNRSYLRSQIMPWFRDRAIGEITHSDVQRWLAGLHATPAAANRSLPVLSVVMRQAEVYGYRPQNSNPCTGVRRYRSRVRERFLTAHETRHLGAALCAREAVAPVPALAVRLLLLTGCRQSEVRGLRCGATIVRDICFCATARPGREPCGSRRPPALCLIACPGRRAGPFLRRTAPAPCPRGRWTVSGEPFGRKRDCPIYGCMTFATACQFRFAPR